MPKRHHTPIPSLSASHVKSFWSRVTKADDENSCWEWTGFCNRDGYGVFSPTQDGVNYKLLAHRVGYCLQTGEHPTIDVLHKCDNPPCVRGSHLYLGTHRDNTNDRMRRGRHHPMPGSQHPFAILTEDDVLEIRRIGDSIKRKDLAKKYGVGAHAILGILRGRSWKHVGGQLTAGKQGKKLLVEDVLAIRKECEICVGERGLIKRIAEYYGVTGTTIGNIIHRQIWRNV